MTIYHRVDGSTVLWKNPRTEDWSPVTMFNSPEEAHRAVQFYNSLDYKGWTTAKLSKSNEKN